LHIYSRTMRLYSFSCSFNISLFIDTNSIYVNNSYKIYIDECWLYFLLTNGTRAINVASFYLPFIWIPRVANAFCVSYSSFGVLYIISGMWRTVSFSRVKTIPSDSVRTIIRIINRIKSLMCAQKIWKYWKVNGDCVRGRRRLHYFRTTGEKEARVA